MISERGTRRRDCEREAIAAKQTLHIVGGSAQQFPLSRGVIGA